MVLLMGSLLNLIVLDLHWHAHRNGAGQAAPMVADELAE
jgi:hypothetical protein